MKKLSGAAIGIFIINIISKLLGFVREMMIAYMFGTSYIVDVYTVAITLPSVIFSFFISGFSQSYIPIASRIENVSERKDFYNNLQTILFFVSVLLSLICFGMSERITQMLAPGFSKEAFELTNIFVKIIAFIFPFMSLFSMTAANLLFYEHFAFANICDFIVFNILIIISIFIAGKGNIFFLIIGYLLSQIIVSFVLWVYAEKESLQKYQFEIDISDKRVKEICFLAFPFGLSLFANQINSVIDRLLASTLGEGVISALNYSNKIQLIIMGLTTMIFASVCYPRLNMFFAKKKYELGMKYISKGIMLTNILAIPLTGFFFLMSYPICQILFQRGAFDANATLMTSRCLSFYALGLVFYSYREILTRCLAANKQQKLILKNTVCAVIFNILFNIIMIRYLSYVGLALATSLAGFLAVILMFLDVKKIDAAILSKRDLLDTIKIIVISIFVIGGIYLFYNQILIFKNNYFMFILEVFIGVISYIILCFVLKIEIVMWIVEKVFETFKGIKRGGEE